MNTRKTYAHALKVFALLYLSEQYQKVYANFFKKIAKAVSDERQYAEPSESERKMFMPWDSIIKKSEELEQKYLSNKSRRTLYEYYIVALFTKIPTLRPSDLLSSEVKENKLTAPTINYYCRKTRTLYLIESKTSKIYGPREVQFPKKLDELVGLMRCRYLLPRFKSDSPNTDSNLCVFMKKIIGLNPSMIRKVYVSNILDSNKSPEERKKIAKICGHSITTQEMLYSKFSKTRHPDQLRASKRLDDTVNKLLSEQLNRGKTTEIKVIDDIE